MKTLYRFVNSILGIVAIIFIPTACSNSGATPSVQPQSVPQQSAPESTTVRPHGVAFSLTIHNHVIAGGTKYTVNFAREPITLCMDKQPPANFGLTFDETATFQIIEADKGKCMGHRARFGLKFLASYFGAGTTIWSKLVGLKKWKLHVKEDGLCVVPRDKGDTLNVEIIAPPPSGCPKA